MDRLLFVLELTAAAWYLAFVITKFGGPFQVFDRMREWRGGKWHGRTEQTLLELRNKSTGELQDTVKELNKDGLMDCIICLMPYISLAILVVHYFNFDILFLPFSIAGLALWLHGFTGWIGRG